ncbi:cytochrome c oxidase subunit 1 [Cichlidogyrus casuarinus]|uniref:Cytochrome c oxidase subunit 1 n=1 Tax=Cichlidogyrus casuarinus TaxID=1844966 RepID=A0ABD2PK61_9PLAT
MSRYQKAQNHLKRLLEMEVFLSRVPNKLKRTASVDFNVLPQFIDRSCNFECQKRSSSGDRLPDFNSWAKKQGYQRKMGPMRQWVIQVWDAWFDDVYPPLENKRETEFASTRPVTVLQDRPFSEPYSEYSDGKISMSDEQAEELMKNTSNTILPRTIDVANTYSPEERALIMEEICLLSENIDRCASTCDICRRGALYRKLGQLEQARYDLETALKMAPNMLSAHWEMHLLCLVEGKSISAIDELSKITRHLLKLTTLQESQRKFLHNSLRAMATVYDRMGNVSMALSTLSQLIRLDPKNADAFFTRALIYEKKGDSLLAFEDYYRVNTLDPGNREALLKRGLYFFEREEWDECLKHLNDLINQCPNDASGRLIRGKCLVKLSHWQDALRDFCVAIHMRPNDYEAFFERGSLLRTAEPEQALKDLSTSLLLNCTEDNVIALFVRGVIYFETFQ